MIEALSHQREFELSDESATLALGGLVAGKAQAPQVIFLRGDLGAGKTTFSRGFLRGRGHDGSVKSPTYTLVEPYELATGSIYHFDLYRLGDAEELEFMGIRDYFGENSVCLVEWADRGLGVLPAADIVVSIETENSGRRLSVSGASDRGRSALERLGERYRA